MNKSPHTRRRDKDGRWTVTSAPSGRVVNVDYKRLLMSGWPTKTVKQRKTLERLAKTPPPPVDHESEIGITRQGSYALLDDDLGVYEIVAFDSNGARETYLRDQTSADEPALWVGKHDVITPEGHVSQQLAKMWPAGYVVTERYVAGFEPPHSCAPERHCQHCRAFGRTAPEY